MKSPEILQAISSDYAEEGEFGGFALPKVQGLAKAHVKEA